jgi:hypothetical protein
MEDMELWHARKHGRTFIVIYENLERKHTEMETCIQK